MSVSLGGQNPILKFPHKVGDRVRNTDRKKRGGNGGKYGVVFSIDPFGSQTTSVSQDPIYVSVRYDDGCVGGGLPETYEILKDIKFLIVYRRHGDVYTIPTQSEKDLRSALDSLPKMDGIDYDDIVVYDITRSRKVELKARLKFMKRD